MSHKLLIHSLGRMPKIGAFFMLLACITAVLPAPRLEAGAWNRKSDVTPHRAAAGASVIGDEIYVMGGLGDSWLDSKDNYIYDPILDQWHERTPMPSARSFPSTAVVGGIIYVIGGATGSLSPTAISSVDAYDPASDTWTAMKNLPKPTYGCHAGVVDGIIYAIGGMYSSDSTRCETNAYDPAVNEWTVRTSRPIRGGCAVTVYDGLIYTFGGRDSSQGVSAAVYVYDPKSDTWTKKKDMPTPRAGILSALVGGKIYVIGGFRLENEALATVEVYDPISDTWEAKNPMPETAAMYAEATVDGRIFVMGGTSDWHTGGQSNWEYNPSLDPAAQMAWIQKEPLPFGRVGGCTSEIDKKIYIMGGLTSSAPTYTNTDVNQVYVPTTNSWSTKEKMPTARAFLATAVVRGEIYAMGGGYPSYLDVVEAYNPVSDAWTTKRNLPKPCMGSRADVVNGIVYLIGGNQTDSLCFAYDPSTDTWTPKKPRPQGGSCGVVAYRGAIYTFGGGGYNGQPVSHAVWVYDPKSDQWTRKKDMPTARSGVRACAVFGQIYLIGGFQQLNGSLNTVEVYDPIGDSWARKSPMPFSSCFVQGAEVDGKVYVMAGTQDWSSGGEENWEYNPALDTVNIVDAVQLLAGPTGFDLQQNYPNPFNPTTVISGQLTKDGQVRLAVLDVLGREVAILVDGWCPAGKFSFTFNAKGLASGVYFYRLAAGNITGTRKMVLMK